MHELILFKCMWIYFHDSAYIHMYVCMHVRMLVNKVTAYVSFGMYIHTYICVTTMIQVTLLLSCVRLCVCVQFIFINKI